METNANYYELLGFSDSEKKLQGDAFNKVLKKKWKKKAVEYHPDRYADKTEEEKIEAEEHFKQISEAYEILNDPQKRHLYDRYGTVKPQHHGFNPFNFDSVDAFGFNPFNPFGKRSEPRVIKGSDVNVVLTVTLKELYNNETVNLTYDVYVPCDECDGKGTKNGKIETCQYCSGSGVYTVTQTTGYMTSIQQTPCPYCNATGKKVTEPCVKCNGDGVVKKTQTLAIKLPKGCLDGTSMRLKKQGNCAPRNEGERGDLRVTIVVDWGQQQFMARTYHDLIYEMNLSILDCLTGTNKEITLPDGKTISITIPTGINSSETLLNAGNYGLMTPSDKRGLLLIKINCLYPKELNSEEIKTINKLKLMPNFKAL